MTTDELYVVGTFALWAGDYGGALEYFSHHSERSVSEFHLRGPVSAEEFIVRAGQKRYAQILKQRKQFDKDRRLFPPDQRDIKAGAHSLRPTDHLAGSIFVLDARNFQMRAYVTRPAWSDLLLENARMLSSSGKLLSAKEPQVPASERQREMGYGLEYPGTLFIQVRVNRMGLIYARGFWSGPEITDFYNSVEKRFQEILSDLDPDGSKEPATEKVRSKS